MSLAGKTAREMLKLPGQTMVAWAIFDPRWYLARYPDARARLNDAAAADVLEFYLTHGQPSGHSPNIWFDEVWHLSRHSGAADAVREGHAQSGFDAYCQGGFRFQSPHWLFNERLYRQRHDDLRDEVLTRAGDINGYDHYLKHGSKEGRIGHRMFDPTLYVAQLDAEERKEAEQSGPFAHYLRHIAAHRSERRTSVYLNPVWYLHRYPAVAEAIENGDWLCALHHYLCNATPLAFDPLAEFSDQFYLSRYGDVAAAVEAKDRRNGYDHFISDGAVELRAPTDWIDLRYYVNAHPSVRADLDLGRAPDAFAHYLAIGRTKGLAPALPPEEHVTEQQAATLFRRTAHDLLPAATRTRPDFTCSATPTLSVVVVLRDGFPQSLLALAQLRANHPGDIQLILVDCGSIDETAEIGRYVLGARCLRFDGSIGFARACGAALHCATADVVLFLGSDVVPAPGAVAAALHRLSSDARIGAIGAKLILGHGRLLEAGGIIWRDGHAQRYRSNGSPAAPEINFLRDVEFCSHAFLMVRGALLRDLDCFDEDLITEELASADLCLRIAAAGQRVVYDPGVVAHYYGQHDDSSSADAKAIQAQQHFVQKHSNQLRFKYIADQRVEVFARHANPCRRILFIDDTIPLREIGSGFVRSNDVVRTMASLGFQVTIFPLNACQFSVARIYADMPDTVEVMYDRNLGQLDEFFAERQGYYDAIWIARTHNLDRTMPKLQRIASGTGRPPRFVLDTEAIASLREAARPTEPGKEPHDVEAAIRQEFANAHFCQNIVAVNPAEAQRLRTLGFSDVAVIGHVREPCPTQSAFAERAGMLFVGAIHSTDSPNYDGLLWFIEEVLPLVEQSLRWETRLTIAGYLAPTISLDRFRGHPRVTLRGSMPNIERLYDSHRIFIAPTRYAAGMPYKVHEAASFGLPVVATELLRRQLGWIDGRDLLSAKSTDPAGFAGQILKLYSDVTLWQTLRDNALARLRAENNRTDYETAIARVLDM